MIKPCPSRGFYLGELLIIVGLLSYAYYLEWHQGLVPCLLCEVQRGVFAVLGGFFLISSLFRFKRRGQLVVNAFSGLFALLGILLAGRQVWLQLSPESAGMGSCDASLAYLWQVMPFSDFVMTVFVGGPECAKITWQFLGLSLAGWSLLWFATFLLLSLWQFVGWAFLRK